MAKYLNKIYIARLESEKPYYSTAIPSDPVIESVQYTYKARIGDRWDTIAYKYLGSATLWYVVANANNALNGSIFIKPGTLITIPESI